MIYSSYYIKKLRTLCSSVLTDDHTKNGKQGELNMQKKWVVSAVGAALLLSACDDTDTRVEADLMIDRGDGGNLVARFDPSASEVPSPNNFCLSRCHALYGSSSNRCDTKYKRRG